MISRQIIRLIIYYIMPLVFVSVFYVLIAKHLFQTKSIILKPSTTQTFLTEINNSKRNQTSMTLNRQSSNKNNSNTNNNQDKNAMRSTLFNNDKPSLGSSTKSTSPSSNNARRNRDYFYGNPSINNNINNNNNNNNSLALHTLYQDVKTRKQLRARHKVAKTVLFLCSVFFICWLPKQIHDLYW